MPDTTNNTPKNVSDLRKLWEAKENQGAKQQVNTKPPIPPKPQSQKSKNNAAVSLNTAQQSNQVSNNKVTVAAKLPSGYKPPIPPKPQRQKSKNNSAVSLNTAQQSYKSKPPTLNVSSKIAALQQNVIGVFNKPHMPEMQNKPKVTKVILSKSSNFDPNIKKHQASEAESKVTPAIQHPQLAVDPQMKPPPMPTGGLLPTYKPIHQEVIIPETKANISKKPVNITKGGIGDIAEEVVKARNTLKPVIHGKQQNSKNSESKIISPWGEVKLKPGSSRGR